jgi:hypothetical protein
MVAVDDVDAATVSTENVWLVDPALINTLGGTVATAALLDSVTVAPPVGAAADKVTVPVTARPPAIDGLDNVTDSNVGVTLLGVVVDDDPLPPHADDSKEAVMAATTTSLVTLRENESVIRANRQCDSTAQL